MKSYGREANAAKDKDPQVFLQEVVSKKIKLNWYKQKVMLWGFLSLKKASFTNSVSINVILTVAHTKISFSSLQAYCGSFPVCSVSISSILITG